MQESTARNQENLIRIQRYKREILVFQGQKIRSESAKNKQLCTNLEVQHAVRSKEQQGIR